MSGQGAVVGGKAVPYDDMTYIPGMGHERFMPHPFGDLKTGPTVTAQKQHSVPDLLGSTASGSLTLTEAPDGLYYRLELPAADELTAELVARGDLPGASFAFSVAPGGATWTVADDGLPLRTISQAALYEVSLVAQPAYPTTSATITREAQPDGPPSPSMTRAMLDSAFATIERVEREDAGRAEGRRQSAIAQVQCHQHAQEQFELEREWRR